jgi:TolB protein
MTPDGIGLTRLTSEGGDDQAAWSPDGSEIAFNRYSNGSQDIYLIRADGSGLRKLTTDGASSSPAWSPDGERIAFAREASGNADIYLMNPDGTHVTRLTDDPLREYTPAWSPDGTRIAFVGYSQGPSGAPSPTRLYVMNADGSALRAIGSEGAAWPSWSPGGTTIAFVNEDDGAIYLIQPDGSGLRLFVDVASLPGGINFPPNFTSRPAWSPDGRRITFAAGDTVSSHLYAIDVDGSGLLELTHGSVSDQAPAWSGGGPLPAGGG